MPTYFSSPLTKSSGYGLVSIRAKLRKTVPKISIFSGDKNERDSWGPNN